MGSNFFAKALDPMGNLVGHVAGPNSFVAKLASYPAGGSHIGMSPAMQQLGSEYNARHDAPAGYVAPARTFAGATPTLAAAAGGYKSAPSTMVMAPSANGPSSNFWAAGSAPTPQAYVQAAGRQQAAGQPAWGQSSYGY